MIWVILILAAVMLVVLERCWSHYAMKAVRFCEESDCLMAEPGETVLWRAALENHSRLPIPFVRLCAYFPNQVTLLTEEGGRAVNRMTTQRSIEWKLSLPPHKKLTVSQQMTFPGRGRYAIARCTIAVGDLMGFRESVQERAWQSVVVIPERSRDAVSLDALGGFLGDISVRRFVQEDPILTVGFREYTGREPMKAISWTRTAVAGSMQVKQYDYTAERHITVLLNTDGASAEEFEACLRLTRSACEMLTQKKYPYRFCTNGNLPGPVGKIFDLAEGTGERHRDTILYGLGGADSLRFYSFPSLVRRTLRQRKRNESYLVITPPLTGEDRDALRQLDAAVGGRLCVLVGREEDTPA